MFARFRLAAHLVDCINDTSIADELAKTVNEICHRLAALLGKPYDQPATEEYAGKDDQPIYLEPEQVAHLLSEMTAFGWRFFETLKNPALVYEWSLEDLSDRVRANAKKEWIQPWSPKALACQAGVEQTAYPEVAWSPSNGLSRVEVTRRLSEVVRELFFSFEGLSEDGLRR
jgi:hypothetical protein